MGNKGKIIESIKQYVISKHGSCTTRVFENKRYSIVCNFSLDDPSAVIDTRHNFNRIDPLSPSVVFDEKTNSIRYAVFHTSKREVKEVGQEIHSPYFANLSKDEK